MSKSIYFLLLLVLCLSFQHCTISSTNYFNQAPPNNTPKLFAPAIVNTDSVELNVVFNASYTEMFMSRIVDGSFMIHHAEFINGQWSSLQPILLYPDSIRYTVACDPSITQDGQTMYFLGVDPRNYTNDITPDKLYRIPPDIYVSHKRNGQWQLATKVASPISTMHFESYPIIVEDNSIYFQSNRPNGAGGRDTYRAQYLSDGQFETPVSISLNSAKNAGSSYISPKENYLISSDRDGFQVSFKKDGEWQAPIPIDIPYEKAWRYYCPFMSPDEKYFFFSRRYNNGSKKGWAGVTKGEVYWVSADVIFDLKTK